MSKRTKTAKRNEAICNAYAKGITQVVLAKKYEVSEPRISQIVKAGQTVLCNTNETEDVVCNDINELLEGLANGNESLIALVLEQLSKPVEPKTTNSNDPLDDWGDYVECPPKDEWTQAMKDAKREAYKTARDSGVGEWHDWNKAGYQAVADMVG